jgi:hypothetical protein
MDIPQQIKNLLEAHELSDAVTTSLTRFEPWITPERPPFFPEYTNHGISHIEAVFNTAEALIREEAWEVFTPADAATLLLAALLHDSAMHLTPDSFVALLKNKGTEYLISDLDRKPWTQLWEDFLAEACRFDGRKLIVLFGNTDPVHAPPLDPEKMTERDKKLIGEFLRRHHCRLAHEIALFGVPTPAPDKIRLSNELPNDIADLAGLVARSHGLPIRSCFFYLESRHALREYKQIHAVFLMALLRTADYLQIQRQRAPGQILKVTRLRSPVSKGEWDFHHAIETIEYHDDPESLFVIAYPQEVKTFVRIKDWLTDFQAELDASWAVLGEVYGPFARRELTKLGLSLRRIRSNLDDVESFSKQVQYIPGRASFTTADPHVLNLLVGPLYNRDPAFGIRELIQNAVDAVRELKEYQRRHSTSQKAKLRGQKADVVVAIDDNESGELWLTVSDRGIGMTPEVIYDYFLRAGASFRESDMWRKEFTTKKGEATVLRSGRFGIGVLAAFLIGNELDVTTRHIDAPPSQGIQFTATLEADIIELKRTSADVGTEIRIKVFDRTARQYDQQKWESAMDWYYLDEPSATITINGQQVKPKYKLPSPVATTLPPYWRRTEHPDYPHILWTYSKAPAISCNGIKVVEQKVKSAFDTSPQDDITGSIRIPNLSVFDPDGKLPLNLQRTDLEMKNPFEEELRRDILRDFLSFVLVYAPVKSMADTSTWDFYQYLPYPGLDAPIRQLAPWFCTQKGVSILDAWHISQVRPKSVLVFFLNPENELLRYITPTVSSPLIGLQWPSLERYFGDPFSPASILCPLLSRQADPELHRLPPVQGTRLLLPTHLLFLLRDTLSTSFSPSGAKSAAGPIFQHFIHDFASQLKGDPKVEHETDQWCIVALGRCLSPSYDFQTVMKNLPAECKLQTSLLAEWYFSTPGDSTRRSPISQAWSDIIRDAVIPYDLQTRRETLPHAFQTLASYIEAHELEKETTEHSNLNL